MSIIYLDNSATTPLCPEAVAAMEEAMGVFGNPSSLHSVGQEAHTLLTRARGQVAAALGIRSPKPGELIFTSCGTEASALAIYGSVYAKPRRFASRVITTDCEHPSVEEAMRKLEADGIEVVRIPTKNGVLDTEAAISALNTPTLLVSMMMVNNETGAHFDVARVFAAAKQRDSRTVTHCDAVQGLLKVPFTPASIHADLVTVSAHKIHGPKGVGALYVHPDIIRTKRITAFVTGGGQEFGLRSGTENIIGIAGFGGAAQAGSASRGEDQARMVALRDRLEGKLRDMGVQMNIPAGDRAPHVLNLTLPSIKSQTMLNYLSAQGICVSSGSACSSHSVKISPSLAAFGLTAHEADCSLRISFSALNTEDEVDRLCEALGKGISTLVRIRK
ncbi:MAG: cysteine desulfurase [Clostridia bacterium]|nr:cysteine desulfurase [Clostridia bacterium]